MSVKQASKDYQKCLDELTRVYEDWIENRRKTIKLLKEIVKDMDSKEFKSNVTNIVGGGFGVASETMILGGLALAPLTGGASLALSGAGLGASVLGGVTNITSDTIAQNYALRKFKEADDKIKDDQKRSGDLERAEKKLTDAIVVLQNEAEITQTDITTIMKSALVTKKGLQVFKIVQKTFRLARGGHRVVGAVGLAAGRAIGKVSGALAVLGIGLNILQIVSSCKDISNGSKSELGKDISNYIVEMEKSLNAVQKYFSETYEFNY